MKSIYKIGIVALSAVTVLSGCIKETFPTSVATNEQVNANPAALESMVNGMAAFVNKYSVLGGSQAYDWGYPSVGIIRDMMCDYMASISSGYEWYSSWIENTNQGDNWASTQFIWNFYTQFLQTANSVIAAVDAEGGNDTQKAYLGMAYCYRAMINLDMGRMYEFKKNGYTSAPELEGKTVPIILEDMTEEEARNNPRADKSDLIEFILSDIDKAIALFGSNFKRSTKTQPDLSVAYGLQARAYLWAGDYTKAKTAAQSALAAGSYKALTESQWTDVSTGFNTANDAWMWCSSTVKEDDVVQSGILNWISWMSSETSFGYASAGPIRLAATGFYNRIPDTDFRKKSWKAPEGSSLNVPMIGATSDYPGSDAIPDYGVVKFRPGSGDPDNYDVAAVCDYPLMRMEEMEFIIAECDARNGNSSTLVNFVKTRNPSYTTSATGADLIEEVLFQKTIEFWGEGILFYDYKRLDHSVTRGYAGTNYYDAAQLNTEGLAPWMNFCIVRTENNANSACVTNPDPSGLVPTWDGE